MKIFESKTYFNEIKQNLISYLYMLDEDMFEVNEFIRALRQIKPFRRDVRNANTMQKALNIAVVISYSRNFKRSLGYKNVDEINKNLTSTFTKLQKKLHNKIISQRDKEFAHSDASANKIELYDGGLFTYSRIAVRQMLTKRELISLKSMVMKIRKSITPLQNDISNTSFIC